VTVGTQLRPGKKYEGALSLGIQWGLPDTSTEEEMEAFQRVLEVLLKI